MNPDRVEHSLQSTSVPENPVRSPETRRHSPSSLSILPREARLSILGARVFLAVLTGTAAGVTINSGAFLDGVSKAEAVAMCQTGARIRSVAFFDMAAVAPDVGIRHVYDRGVDIDLGAAYGFEVRAVSDDGKVRYGSVTPVKNAAGTEATGQIVFQAPCNTETINSQGKRVQGVRFGLVSSQPATVEAKTTVMILPKPAAWNKVPTLNVVQATSYPAFPKTREEAAATFGVDGSTKDPKRWKKTAVGEGWHLSEAQGDDTDALNVNPRGYLIQGYYDTLPGRNSFAWVIIDTDGNIPAQGATVWNEKRGREKAVKLQNEMFIPKWDEKGVITNKPAVVIAPYAIATHTVTETPNETPTPTTAPVTPTSVPVPPRPTSTHEPINTVISTATPLLIEATPTKEIIPSSTSRPLQTPALTLRPIPTVWLPATELPPSPTQPALTPTAVRPTTAPVTPTSVPLTLAGTDKSGDLVKTIPSIITPTPNPTPVPEIRPTPSVSENLPNSQPEIPVWLWVLGSGFAGFVGSRLYRKWKG